MAQKFKVLDVFFYKGNSLTSKAIRLLESVRYGMPFKDCYSHIDLGYDDKSTFSAEAKGAEIVPIENIDTIGKSDVVVYRYKNITQEQIDKFYAMVPEYMGRGYGYARYAIDAATIFSFVLFIMGILFGWLSWKFLLLFGGLFIILQIVAKLLQKLDKGTSDCSELSAIFLDELQLMPYFSSDPRNEFPNSQLSKMEMMRWYSHADIVATFDYKTKTWKEYPISGNTVVRSTQFAFSDKKDK